jgi:hypothetical protein
MGKNAAEQQRRNIGKSNAILNNDPKPDRHLPGYPLLAGEGRFERAKIRVRSRKVQLFSVQTFNSLGVYAQVNRTPHKHSRPSGWLSVKGLEFIRQRPDGLQNFEEVPRRACGLSSSFNHPNSILHFPFFHFTFVHLQLFLPIFS